MRLIDADALERMGYVLTRTYQQDQETMVYETKKLSDMPSAQPQTRQWIPCSERMPEVCTNCFVTVKRNEELIVDTDLYWSGGWDDYGDDVIAWMPKPEPYKEVNHD